MPPSAAVTRNEHGWPAIVAIGSRLLLALAGAVLTGCHPQPPPSAIGRPNVIVQGAQTGGVQSSGQFFDVDNCADRLHDIEGELLAYYQQHEKLPASLSELRPVFGEELNFTCPVSHLPYVYNPAGLKAPGEPRPLVVYDAAPVHGGARWGIVFAVPRAGAAPSPGLAAVPSDVIKIPEARFRQFVPVAAPKASPTSQRSQQGG